MGQSNTKVRRFLDSNPLCIFCGGITYAESQDHIPPRTFFIDRKWPEDYVFASCIKCNNESSDSEYIVGIMVKMTWGLLNNHKFDEAIYSSMFIELKRKKPEVFSQLLNGLSAATKKRLARDIGYVPPIGALYADLPIVKFPKEFNHAIKVFGRKLAIALHYKHTNKIPPTNFGFKFKWATNFDAIKGEHLLNEDLLKTFAPAQSLMRENVDLSEQFNYSYVLTEDSRNSAFHCNFSKSFEILFLLSFDNVINDDVN